MNTIFLYIYLFIFIAIGVYAAPAQENAGQINSNSVQNNVTTSPSNVNTKDQNLIIQQKHDNVTSNHVTSQSVSAILASMPLISINKTGSNELEKISADTITTVSINVSNASIIFEPSQKNATEVKKNSSKDDKNDGLTLPVKDSTSKTKQDFNDEEDYITDDENMKSESGSGKKGMPDNLEIEKDQKLDSSSKDQPAYSIAHREMDNDKSSHFFAYMLTLMVMAIFLYLLFHNKKRILALVLEGRSEQSRRRSNRARYHKLDNNLEEAMSNTKGSNSSLSQVY